MNNVINQNPNLLFYKIQQNIKTCISFYLVPLWTTERYLSTATETVDQIEPTIQNILKIKKMALIALLNDINMYTPKYYFRITFCSD